MVESRPEINYESFAAAAENIPVPTVYCDIHLGKRKLGLDVDMGILLSNLRAMGLSDRQIVDLNISFVRAKSLDGDYGAFDNNRTIEIALDAPEGSIKSRNEKLQETFIHETSHYRNRNRDDLKEALIGAVGVLRSKGLRKRARKLLDPERAAKQDEKKFQDLDQAIWVWKRK